MEVGPRTWRLFWELIFFLFDEIKRGIGPAVLVFSYVILTRERCLSSLAGTS